MKNVILVCTLAGGLAWAQNPQVVQSTRTALNTVQQNATTASNQALGIKQTPAKGAPATAKQATATAKKSTSAKKTVSKSAADSTKTAVAVKQAPAPVKVKVASGKANAAAVKAPEKAAEKKSAKPVTAKVAVKEVAPKKESKAAAAPQKKAEAPKTQAPTPAATNPAPSDTASEDSAKSEEDSDKQDKKWSAAGKRDPFISPVVNHTGGSGCSTGKKCLEIGAINLRGVVHSDAGFIAVVPNSLNKAYFLRENDPVFDGYVVKITGDSIIFKETLQDKLGKSFTREVTKKITTPAV